MRGLADIDIPSFEWGKCGEKPRKIDDDPRKHDMSILELLEESWLLNSGTVCEKKTNKQDLAWVKMIQQWWSVSWVRTPLPSHPNLENALKHMAIQQKSRKLPSKGLGFTENQDSAVQMLQHSTDIKTNKRCGRRYVRWFYVTCQRWPTRSRSPELRAAEESFIICEWKFPQWITLIPTLDYHRRHPHHHRHHIWHSPP